MRPYGRLGGRRALLAIGFAAMTAFAPAIDAVADPVEVVPCPNPAGCGTFAFRDQRTPNTIGLAIGDRISLGAEVRPNPGPGNTNARRSVIPLGLDVRDVDAPSGATLSLKLLARVTCSGKTHASGTARLWLNDALTSLDANAPWSVGATRCTACAGQERAGQPKEVAR